MRQSPSPVVTFLLFVGLLVGSLLIAALLSPPLFHLFEVFPIHRVFNRIAMAMFLIGTVLLMRKLSITNRIAMGYACSPPTLLRTAGLGFAAGISLLAAVTVLLFGLGLRRWSVGSENPLLVIMGLLPTALLSGFTVAVVEETFFRGALYGAIRRQRNIALAIVLTSLLYAAVHFLGERLRIPADQVTWRSGFVLLSNFFNAYRNPLELVDGFVALSLVGCLLAVIRERMGHIGTAIGMHAGFVVVILLVRKSSTADYHQPMSFLVSNRDGILGWLVALMAALTLLVVLKWLKPDSPVRKARSEYGGLESGPEGNEP